MSDADIEALMGSDESCKAPKARGGADDLSLIATLKDGETLDFTPLGTWQTRLNPWSNKEKCSNVYDHTNSALRIMPLKGDVQKALAAAKMHTAPTFGGLEKCVFFVSRTGAGKESTRYTCGFKRPVAPEEWARMVAAIKANDGALHEIKDAEPFDDSKAPAAAGSVQSVREQFRPANSTPSPAGIADGDIPF